VQAKQSKARHKKSEGSRSHLASVVVAANWQQQQQQQQQQLQLQQHQKHQQLLLRLLPPFSKQVSLCRN